MSLKFTGSYSELQTKLSSLNGTWDESQTNKKVLRVGNGLLNWYESTGTIQFQGQGAEKEKLESEVPHLIYPQQFPKPEIVAKVENIPIENTQKSINIKEQTIERKYLESNINDSELIIGIVSAVGTESKRVIDPLKDRLMGFGYDVEEVRVSGILTSYANTGTSREYDRIKHYMESGDSLRKDSQSNAILAAGVAKQILNNRTEGSTKKAYIINSLKHPSEVDLLRKVYGDGFYLIGIHADEKRRHKYLTDDKGCTLEQANELIKIDEDESFGHGQKTRDTYHLADFFLNLGKNDDHVKNRLQRFLELIFSHPYKNPTFDEFAMFMAFNSSVRSGDLSRQVGAVISQNNQIIATGANDVPQSGGGLYWAEADPETGEVSDHQDGKDYTRDGDSNKQAQAEIALEIAKKLLDSGIVASDKELGLNEILIGSKISDLTEFGRVVHAEMDALLSCGRAGIPTVGTTLYCTTFPCHNCAKHIIAGGMKRVVYVEPYPKSRALDFHSESIQLKSEFDKSTQDDQLIAFEPFIGVGPRRFLDLFSMSLGAGSKLKRKDKKGSTLVWDKSNAPIRTPLIPKSYIEIEQAAAEIWEEYSAKDSPL
ncbi:anti-phage dCTP deaminase [Pseudoalteromonas sp. Z1A8]|uniref:anti-phage dCTP deaminase n=1 Tax=Pseudoalteromonas sp. Z1A8 TaxID=2686354 RepID=UPI00140A7BDE|nr:anti-phage dCTP deaminase [Pseudoalteromonas sp. Z1A8]